VVLVAAAYFLSARLGYAFSVGGMVTLWPPSGLMLGLLAISGYRHWPAIVLGGLGGSLVSDLYSNYSVPLAIAAALANGFETFVGALVLRQYLGSPVQFTTLRGVSVLVIGVVGLSNAVTSLFGAAMLSVGFGMPFGFSWLVWWVGDGLGMLIVAPVILAGADALRRPERFTPRRITEAAVLLLAVFALSMFALGPVPAWVVHPGPYLLAPILLWAGVRFGLSGASLSMLVVACVAIWHASLGVGPFAISALQQESAILEAYAFLAISSTSALIAAAALNERQEAISQLRESREQYRNVVETATDPIFTIDSRNRIRFANSATERVFGFRRDELIGRDLSLLIPGAKDKGLRKDGREVPLEVSYGRITEPGASQLTIIARDISEQRAAERAMQALEEQYRQSQKMEAIGQLAGGIAHDFNNLLTIVQVNAELLLEEVGAASPLRPGIEQVQTAAHRAASLTRQLLAFSRRQLLEPRIMSLAESLANVETMLGRLLGEHVAVRISIPRPVGPVLADPGQVEQVILNLSINARDAMPGGGQLTLELTEVALDETAAPALDVRPGRYARLAVIDTGIGMDDATVGRVFEPFFTTKPMGRGTGLGLSTVHGIVKQSGGGIRVHSRPGQGAMFEVFLPRVDGAVERVQRPGTPPPGTRQDLLLVVEDEEDVGRLARRILERGGYRVLLASTPSQALEIAARTARIDGLLTDVVLPEMSGRALVEKLLLLHPHLQVLYMSGYTDDALTDHGVLEPGTAFIEKPFTAESLLTRLREVIHGRGTS
jgi:two-component system cell cycle sensor histidine kinase/response regulator CckA